EEFGDIIVKVGQSRPGGRETINQVAGPSRLAIPVLNAPAQGGTTIPPSSDPTNGDISAGTLTGNTPMGGIGTTVGLNPAAGNLTPNTALGGVGADGGALAGGGGTTGGGSAATGGGTSNSGLLGGGLGSTPSGADLSGLSIASGTTAPV